MSVTTSSKRSQSKSKNNLASSVHIFEDPRFKEYETIPIEKFKLDKEKAQRDYNQLQNDLINLKEEYIKTKQRAADRETELRSHINNLLIKYRTRDPQQNLENINALHQEIINNIKTLEAQSKEDIREKKKDMETRIKLRLVDSEINYNRELEKKVKDQQGILRALHEFTQDMQKIRNNYNSIKDKVDTYLKENAMYRNEIQNLEAQNENLKTEIMRLKHLNNKLSIKIMSKKDKNSQQQSDNFQTDEISKVNLQVKKKFQDQQKEKFRNKIKSQYGNNNNLGKQNLLNNVDISIDKIIQLLTNEEFVNKHYRECSVISSLLNIYEKTNQKIKSLQNEYNSLIDHHPIYDRLVSIIANLKNKDLNNKLKCVSTMSKKIMNEILGNYIITMKKEQRKELIETIVNDQQIMKLIYDEKLPNILNRDRQLGN
jgi:hypothetical protein